MKRKVLVFVFVSSVVFFNNVKGQSCDPWIISAYKQLYNRTPNNDECDIHHYNNGSWRNYNELVGYIRAYRGDPWIFKIYQEVYYREPNAWELNIRNYNNGSWNNYNELKNYIIQFQNSLSNNHLQIKIAPLKENQSIAGFFIDGRQVGVDVITAGAGNVIAAGGGNVIAAGGGNVIAAGGGNVIAAGGGNIAVNSGMAGVNFGGRYTVQSVGTKVIATSGNGALIIR